MHGAAGRKAAAANYGAMMAPGAHKIACIFGLELEGYSSRKNEEGEELRGPAPLRREAQMPRMGFEAE